MIPVVVCFVVSTIGRRPDDLARLLDSITLLDDGTIETVVGVCDQSNGNEIRTICEDYAASLDIFRTCSRPGLSAGRNSVIRDAPEKVTHFAFPNDTSIIPPTFSREFAGRHSDVDLLAVEYRVGGVPRYTLPPAGTPLDRWNVWRIAEPAMILSRSLVECAGGFDETLGAGCLTKWQSGEGTDLLLRAMNVARVVHWDSDLAVIGVSQNYGLAAVQRQQKFRDYGRGYGWLLGKWRYPLLFRLKAVCAPFIRVLVPPCSITLRDAKSSSLGRFEGLIGFAASKRSLGIHRHDRGRYVS